VGEDAVPAAPNVMCSQVRIYVRQGGGVLGRCEAVFAAEARAKTTGYVGGRGICLMHSSGLRAQTFGGVRWRGLAAVEEDCVTGLAGVAGFSDGRGTSTGDGEAGRLRIFVGIFVVTT